VKSSKQSLRHLAILIILFASILVTPAPQAAANPADINNPHDLEVFWDSIIPDQLQKYHIAGAVVTVVKDGRLVFSKGYGYAYLATRKPVLADQTLFRVASISKLFTATAVMQLAEQGSLILMRTSTLT
jgi:CubicO group peptidase (beta-lactamase class C family)